MKKLTTFGMRISEEDLEAWQFYSVSVGYDSLSEFVRDSINGLIRAKQKPSKVFIIENIEEV